MHPNLCMRYAVNITLHTVMHVKVKTKASLDSSMLQSVGSINWLLAVHNHSVEP